MTDAVTILEICVDDLLGLRAAVLGGADRIELCSALSIGGLTPSPAFTAEAVQTGIPVHAMARQRSGGFDYDAEEIALILKDMARLADLGVAGIVVGASRSNGELNERALARFREAAGALALTLHRVIDLTPDPVAAARIAAELGFDYVLTSGGARSAFDGRQKIREMVSETKGKLTIIAGAGITPQNAAAIIKEAGVSQIHASASRPAPWDERGLEEMGFANRPRRVTDAALVAALREAITRSI